MKVSPVSPPIASAGPAHLTVNQKLAYARVEAARAAGTKPAPADQRIWLAAQPAPGKAKRESMHAERTAEAKFSPHYIHHKPSPIPQFGKGSDPGCRCLVCKRARVNGYSGAGESGDS